jgi:hypothetical protein
MIHAGKQFHLQTCIIQRSAFFVSNEVWHDGLHVQSAGSPVSLPALSQARVCKNRERGMARWRYEPTKLPAVERASRHLPSGM